MVRISNPLTQATSILGTIWIKLQAAKAKKGAANHFLLRDLKNLTKPCSLPLYSFQPSWSAQNG